MNLAPFLGLTSRGRHGRSPPASRATGVRRPAFEFTPEAQEQLLAALRPAGGSTSRVGRPQLAAPQERAEPQAQGLRHRGAGGLPAQSREQPQVVAGARRRGGSPAGGLRGRAHRSGGSTPSSHSASRRSSSWQLMAALPRSAERGAPAGAGAPGAGAPGRRLRRCPGLARSRAVSRPSSSRSSKTARWSGVRSPWPRRGPALVSAEARSSSGGRAQDGRVGQPVVLGAQLVRVVRRAAPRGAAGAGGRWPWCRRCGGARCDRRASPRKVDTPLSALAKASCTASSARPGSRVTRRARR